MQAILILSLYICIHTVIALDIDLQNQGLEVIPADLNTSVENLNLDDNVITSIEERSLANYSGLRQLSIRRNRIRYIHHLAFIYNIRLNGLMIPWNMDLVPGEWLTPVRPTLEQISVSGIAMETLEDMKVWEFTNLLHIHATVHCDRGVVLNVTCLPPRLRLLGLWCNHLTDVSNVLRLTELRQLYLYHNNLVTMPDLFDFPLRAIDLRGNRWRCDYDMCWLRMWNYFHSTNAIISPVVCASPVELMGIDIMDINPARMRCFEGYLNDIVIS